MRDSATPRDAVVAGKFAREFCKNRQARVFAAAEDDAEIVESRLATGKIAGRICGIKNLAAGTRGEIELGTICGIDEITGVKKFDVLCMIAVILYFGLLTYFSAHETMLKELFAGAAGFAVVILMLVSFVLGLNLYQRKKFYAFIPFLICSFGLAAGFVGAIALGESIKAANFQKKLPRFTEAVQLIESGEIKSDSMGRVQLPTEFSDLAYLTFTHTNRDVRMVIFTTDEAFPLWTSGYIYISKENANEETKFIKARNCYERVNTNWFYVSD